MSLKNYKFKFLKKGQEFVPAPETNAPNNVKNDATINANQPGSDEKLFAPVPAKPSYTAQSNVSVKNMQIAIQNFANSVVNYKKNDDFNKKKDFNDFLTEQYLEQSKLKGKEYTPDPTKQNQQDKNPTELVEHDNVVDNLKRIGHGSNEVKADGVWGFRTNNALKNIHAFGDGLLKITDDFKANPLDGKWSFNQDDLNQMRSHIIPVDSQHISDKGVVKLQPFELELKSKLLTPLINKLAKFYDEYVSSIMSHPAYASYIENKSPLLKIGPKSESNALTPEQQKLLTSKATLDLKMILPDGTKDNTGKDNFKSVTGFSIGYLEGIENLSSFMQNVLGYNKVDSHNPDNQKKIINMIKDYINKALTKKSE